MDWRQSHRIVIEQFIKYIDSISDKFILKGGTSLMLCYGLDRFSEDIDLDGFDTEIIDIVDTFCKLNGYKYNINKNTNTVKRCMIHYGGLKPLKIETSYRLKNLNTDVINNINGILVYNIQSILAMKLSAYSNRDKIRDLYDVVFIGLNYWPQLDQGLIMLLTNTLMYKGIEQFDYIIRTQSDELINNEKLADGFLTLWNRLGIL